MVIDLRTKALREYRYTRVPKGPYVDYYALTDHAVLGVHSEYPGTRVALTLAKLPDFHEEARVAFALPGTRDPDPRLHDSDPIVSADRTTLVYAFSRRIVCWRAVDLSIAWMQRIEPDFYGVGNLAMTPRGDVVAAVVMDWVTGERVPRDYVGIYRGSDGAVVGRLQVSGRDGLAISPDGKRIAIGKWASKNQDIQLIVEMYDVETGQIVAKCMHDAVQPGRYQVLNASFDHQGIQFTPDGAYLVTSGNNQVKIWELERAAK